MAKRKPKPQAAGKLAGKRLALVGKFGYRDLVRKQYASQIQSAGGAVVDGAKAAADYVVVGEGRGGKPPGDLAKLQKKWPQIQVLSPADFARLVLPDREELLREIGKGRRKEEDRFWEGLAWACHESGVPIDLRKADLRKADLYGAHLQGVDLTGSDLRGATLKYSHFGNLERVNFDDCKGESVYLQNLQQCTFRNAELEDTWMFDADAKRVEACDFTAAKMRNTRFGRGTLVDCKFAGADLSDSELEAAVFERADFTKADLSRVHASTAKFAGCTFAKANLSRADLRGAALAGADLRNANLREAVLSEADLTGANVAGADFQDAVLTGTKLQGLDLSKARNFKPPVARAVGPKLQELAAAAAGAKEFVTSAEIDLGQDEFARLQVSVVGRFLGAHSRYFRDGSDVSDRVSAPTFEQGLLNLADRWPKATLRLDSIRAKGSKTVRGPKLKELAAAAWAETFGVADLSPQQLQAQRASQHAAALSERDALMKKIRAQGVKAWNGIDFRLRRRIELQGADLSGAKLDKVNMCGYDFKGANFSNSSLIEAELWNSEFPKGVFSGANLERCSFENSVLNGANFQKANLTGANLANSKLLGADFTGAKLKDASFAAAQYDQTTIFPKGFAPPSDMTWKGDGPPPNAKKVKAAKAGSLDFDSFLAQLNTKVEVERMKKAASMLKAERFQLFAEVKEDSLVGIVKSQTDKDLVYSCRLVNDGAFSCCTQNLRPCGGLRGALCKHLLVLIVGLAKAGQLDAATVDHWIDLSRSQKPAIDEDVMSATFLRYKGAEAGEIDWRPTETIPEDFYAM